MSAQTGKVRIQAGRRILQRLAEELAEVANVEVPPRSEGNTMVQVLSPRKEKEKESRGEKKGGRSAKPVASG